MFKLKFYTEAIVFGIRHTLSIPIHNNIIMYQEKQTQHPIRSSSSNSKHGKGSSTAEYNNNLTSTLSTPKLI